MRTMSGYAMVGGTIPPQSDSGEISRVLVLNLLWQSKRCSRTAQDISVLTTPSLLSMDAAHAEAVSGHRSHREQPAGTPGRRELDRNLRLGALASPSDGMFA